ncbi:MAG: PAS domain-containing protein [Caldilineaceae bacterium]|nr:PAS domain-containing protein [Caldilineaceae bacterium]
MTSDSASTAGMQENGVEAMSSATNAEAMQERQALFAVLAQIAESLRRLFDPFCEVVIHDFSDFEHSIIHLEGNITNRKLGGAATDLLLSKARSGDTDEDLSNYLTSLAGGRLMKSGTVFLRDETGRAYGAFCVNFDITAFVSVRKLLGAFVSTEDQGDIVETFSDDIEETIQSLLTDTLHEVGKGQPLMSREEKIDLIARLDERGIFQVKKAVPILADQLGLSRATVYNYLREAREEK